MSAATDRLTTSVNAQTEKLAAAKQRLADSGTSPDEATLNEIADSIDANNAEIDALGVPAASA